MLGIPRRRGPTKAYVGELAPFPANGAGVGLPPLLVGRGWESLKRSGHCSRCCRARGKTYRAGLVHSEEGGARLWVWGYRDAIAMVGTISWR